MAQPPPIVPGRPVQPAAPVPPAPFHDPLPAAKRGMSTGRMLFIVFGSFGLFAVAAGLGMAAINASSTTSTPRAQPSPPATTTRPPVRSTATLPAVVVPGLPAAAAAHIGLTAANAAEFLGFDAFNLTLSSGGTGWAINGT